MGLGGQDGTQCLAERHQTDLEPLHEEHKTQYDGYKTTGDDPSIGHILAQNEQLKQHQIERQRHYRPNLLHETDFNIRLDQPISVDRPKFDLGSTVGKLVAIRVTPDLRCNTVI